MPKLLHRNFSIYTVTLSWGIKVRGDVKNLISQLNPYFREELHDTFWQSRTWAKVSPEQWERFVRSLRKKEAEGEILYSTLEMLYMYLFGCHFADNALPKGDLNEEPIPDKAPITDYQDRMEARYKLISFLIENPQNFSLEDCRHMRLIDLKQLDNWIAGDIIEVNNWVRLLDITDEQYLFYDVKRNSKDKPLSLQTLRKVLLNQ